MDSAIGEDVATIVELDWVTIPNETPSFKLMGTADGTSFPVSDASFQRRRAKLRFATTSFGDRIQGRPAVVIGMR